MKKSILCASLLSVFMLTACDKTYTVEYFNEHHDERMAMLKKCNNGEVDSESQNCRNAGKSGLEHP